MGEKDDCKVWGMSQLYIKNVSYEAELPNCSIIQWKLWLVKSSESRVRDSYYISASSWLPDVPYVSPSGHHMQASAGPAEPLPGSPRTRVEVLQNRVSRGVEFKFQKLCHCEIANGLFKDRKKYTENSIKVRVSVHRRALAAQRHSNFTPYWI